MNIRYSNVRADPRAASIRRCSRPARDVSAVPTQDRFLGLERLGLDRKRSAATQRFQHPSIRIPDTFSSSNRAIVLTNEPHDKTGRLRHR